MSETTKLPTFASEEAALKAEVGECCMGSSPYCAGGCLVEIAVKKRAEILNSPTLEPVASKQEVRLAEELVCSNCQIPWRSHGYRCHEDLRTPSIVEAHASQLESLAKFAADLQAKPTVTKADRAELVNRIRMVHQKIASDLPFVATQFNRQMSKTVHEAKGEIEAHFLHQVLDLGLAKLQENGLEGMVQPEVPAIEDHAAES